ncbi:pyridoxamine 5'-phosphate oxidase family protein [Pseudaestuariivita atlantica]|uniref:Pyridoxamine 5'-phosphate oxidase n=1 Tax=Pseudaestuariivita atlantica TaxID=1317121 RepID=A0A0L1JQF9_9RHOB|nr:pyridoxamine 5'-phosphate oxidase family protein [Pseudaestuariivita atlantica]KNG93965.1 pyridoxamine 5'-phosphate oxidase [Pseudaestuariivita atlantica]
MGTQFTELDDRHIAFITEQPIFFSGSAARDGKINVSPKGRDSLRVLGPNRILWRNLTGSGNETAAHLEDHPRMTLMWCSFGIKPQILRCFGTARAVHRQDADWDDLNGHFEPHIAARQVFDMAIDMVQTSCGYAVPRMDLVSERDTLEKWAADKGEDGLKTFWGEYNARTLDGVPTRIVEKTLGHD